MTKNKTEFDVYFGEFINFKRLERGWSQADLAERLNNNFQNVSRLERGQISPSLYWCGKIACVFELELDELISQFVFYTQKKS